jgi:hypothetical protein
VRGSPAAVASERWAFRTFAAVVVIAVPCLVFLLGDHRWFHGDDWTFLFGRSATADDLFRPSNSHWSTMPILVFRALYATVGLRAYWPYQLVVVSFHLAAACLLRALMRNSGVHPWIATAAATAFVFYGAGYANVIWAFQIGFTGCLAFGLAQLWLADHDGPFDRRDWLGLVAGLLALMSAGLSVITIATVGLAVLLRRGWKIALLHTVPLGVIFVVWASITHPDNSGPLGYPDIDVVVRWLLTSSTGTFLTLGGSLLVGWILFAFAVAGTTWAWREKGPPVRAAVPTAMAVGGLVFIATACAGRWSLGIDAARGSRFLHVIAAFLLPSIALGATVITAHLARLGPVGRLAVPVVSIVLLLGIPPGLQDYSEKPFNAQYFEAQKRVLLNVTRIPEARQVPRDVRPIPDPFRGRFVEIGYLRDAARAGKLPVRHDPLTRALREEMKVRVAVRQDPDSLPGFGGKPCPTRTEPVRLRPRKGTDLRITSPVVIRTSKGSQPLFGGVTFAPFAGTDLRIELDGLELELVAPPKGAPTFQLCLPG